MLRAAAFVAILAFGNFLYVLDRGLTALMMPVIRQDIALSAAQAGLITGLAFVLVLVFVMLPAARLADRIGSRHVIGGALLIWSGATMIMGLAGNFLQLFGARMLVGAGEAGFTPAANAALAASFSPKALGRALALFGSGLSFGLVFGTYLAGAFEAEVGWRGTFAIIGGVGVVWAAVTWLAWPHLIPPPAAPTRPRAPQPGAIETLRLLLKTPAFGTIIVGAVLHAFSVNAISQWLPSFLHDTYDMPIKEVGRWVGLTFNTASIVGALAIGFIIDLFAPETKMRQCMRWSWVSLTLTVPLYIGGLLGGGDYSIWLFVPAYLAGALYQAPMYYVVQRMVPDEIRAAANAVVLTTFMISGLGLAPALVGLGSDILESWGVVPHLAVAMTAGASVNFASAYFFFRAEKKLAASTIS